MKPQQLRSMLQQTLDDFRMSRGERQALSRILEHTKPSDATLELYRSIAFELARESIADVGPQVAGEIVGWLEDVAKVLQAQAGKSSRTHSVETHFSPDDDCVGRLRGMFAAAKQAIDICVFTITDDRISDRILAAHRRGIAVRIITDNDKSGDAGSDIDRLADRGIPVRIDFSPFHMHHKFAVFDRTRLLTGSYNWTRTAAKENEENFLITDDPRLVQSFAATFEKLWDKFA